MSASSKSSAPVASQYHHFVPQFMLKEFAHTYAPRKRTKGRGRPKHTPVDKSKSQPRPGELVLNRVDLCLENPIVTETLVRRVLGEQDMYRDSSLSESQQQEVEGMFSRLESNAAPVFRKITEAFEQQENGLWLTRDERNLLRKFLFLLKYRGPTFHERFNHEKIDDYTADDRDLLIKYMREKGFKRPIDVWLENLRVIIRLKMDVESKWIADLPKHMYPQDAKWVIMHCEFSYMAICTPSRPGDEFILADNSYHIYEGRSNEVFDPSSGNMKPLSWIVFHEFAPISPKLMIVLRSSLLPSAIEDANPRIRAARQLWWSTFVEDAYGPSTTSILSDLPIEKPQNNYSVVVDGALQPLSGEDGTASKEHKFLFNFFRIDTEHVNKINGVLLDNASTCTSVAFGTRKSFKATLEWYLTVDPNEIGKRVTASQTDPKRLCLIKLAKVLNGLGSSCQPRWEEINGATFSEEEMMKLATHGFREALREIPESVLEGSQTEIMRIYLGLGGSMHNLPDDMQQAELMLKLRIKVDMWSTGLDEDLRQNIRENLWEMYLQLPRRRVWFYLKRWRAIVLADSMDRQIPTMKDIEQGVEGPEDVIAKASNVIAPGRFNHLMYAAAMNDLMIKKCPSFRPWSKFSMDDDGRTYVLQLRHCAFTLPGLINDCGITPIKEFVDNVRPRITYDLTREDGDFQEKTILSKDQEIEMFTRGMVKEMFRTIIGHMIEGHDFDEFFRVFFELVYPTP